MRLLGIYMLFCLGFAGQAQGEDMVFEATAAMPMKEAYDRVYKALEENRFWVVFEADIGNNLSGFAKRWGDDYNKNNLESIKSMVFCNPWYANQVSNKDPSMLALCPLRLSLIHRKGQTKVLFVRPSRVAQGSPAESVLRELEQEVVAAINGALRQ